MRMCNWTERTKVERRRSLRLANAFYISELQRVTFGADRYGDPISEDYSRFCGRSMISRIAARGFWSPLRIAST